MKIKERKESKKSSSNKHTEEELEKIEEEIARKPEERSGRKLNWRKCFQVWKEETVRQQPKRDLTCTSLGWRQSQDPLRHRLRRQGRVHQDHLHLRLQCHYHRSTQLQGIRGAGGLLLGGRILGPYMGREGVQLPPYIVAHHGTLLQREDNSRIGVDTDFSLDQ